MERHLKRVTSSSIAKATEAGLSRDECDVSSTSQPGVEGVSIPHREGVGVKAASAASPAVHHPTVITTIAAVQKPHRLINGGDQLILATAIVKAAGGRPLGIQRPGTKPRNPRAGLPIRLQLTQPPRPLLPAAAAALGDGGGSSGRGCSRRRGRGGWPGPTMRRGRSWGSPTSLKRNSSIWRGRRSVSCSRRHMRATLSSMAFCSCFSLTTSSATAASSPSSIVVVIIIFFFFFPFTPQPVLVVVRRRRRRRTTSRRRRIRTAASAAAAAVPARDLPQQVLSWRTKLEKLLCLKCAGSSVCEKTKGSTTTKLLFSFPHAITASVLGSFTIRYVFTTNGAAAKAPPPPPRYPLIIII
ncbi:hypothetical protein ACMD2_14594 [Ananas comosus]|uniref:Uncharacterized protein n=1 Tax=Ananas comosus TaxID=4615 RepID=A0A199ULW7_ANACO|nr:hypothetical protein ACMD2_14594 [Ananas comosus]